MITVNCAQVLKDLAGNDIKVGEKDFTMGQALANIVVADTSGGKMKLYNLGTRFYQSDSVDLDDADLSLTKSAVKSSNAYGALIVGQIEAYLESL